MGKKKVIMVIVEGPSDENAIGGVLKEYFTSEEVKFAVVHGDITSQTTTTVDNVIKKINKLICDLRMKYGYNLNDFIKVIHIVDTDGVFTKNCVVHADVDGVRYYEDHMECNLVDTIIGRNEHKAKILFKLYSTGQVNKIEYRVYFNSCNLEHVLYGILKDFSDDEKEKMADIFAEEYEGKVNDFISFISDGALAVPGTYKETWRFIEKDKHSLERHSNLHLIFQK